MDNRYDKLRNKLRQESDLPESYSWDSMEESILAKVKGEGAEKKLSLFRWLSIGLVLLIGAVASFSFLTHYNVTDKEILIENNQERIPAQNFKSEQTNIDQSNTLITAIDSDNIEKQNVDIENRNIADRNQGETKESKQNGNDFHIAKPAGERIKVHVNSKKNSKEKKLLGPFVSKEKNIAKQKPNPINPENNLAIVEAGSEDLKQSITTERAKETRSTILGLSQLVSNALPHVLFHHKTIAISDVSFASNPIQPVSKLSRLSVELGAGLTYLSPNLRGEDFQTRQRSITEKGLLAYSTNISMHYQLNSEWTVSAGLSYAKYSSRLDYFDSRDTMTLHENVPVETNSNSLTGESSTIYDDVLVDALSYDRVIHYNDYKFFTIPVSVSRIFKKSDRVDFNLGLGIKYNHLIVNSGRTLDYTESDHTLYKVIDQSEKSYAKSNVGLLGSIGVNYRISSKMYLSTGLHASYSPKDMDSSEAIAFKPLMMDLRLGLGYRF